MRILAFILLAIAASVLARVPPKPDDLETLPQEEFTELAIKELQAMQKKRLLTDVQKPECSANTREMKVQCSIKLKWMKKDRKLGLSLGWDIRSVGIKVALYFDDKSLISHTATFTKFCAPLPGIFSMIKLCGQAYYLDIKIKPIYFNVCFLVTLSKFFHLDFNCIRIENGRFTHHHDYDPSSRGIVTMSIEEGNVKFKLENPIPDAIMKKIEEGWKDLKEKVGDGLKDALDKTKDVAEKVKDKVTGWFKDVFG